jgi:hypothetical protein
MSAVPRKDAWGREKFGWENDISQAGFDIAAERAWKAVYFSVFVWAYRMNSYGSFNALNEESENVKAIISMSFVTFKQKPFASAVLILPCAPPYTAAIFY